MKLRRRAILADLSRPRLGLDEFEVQMALRPKTGRVLVLGALGFTPSPHKSDPRENFDAFIDEKMRGRKFIEIAGVSQSGEGAA